MKRTTNILLASLLFTLGWSTVSSAEDNRYISIRNTDSAWIQGLCSLIFRLDNGGDGEFGHLAITIQLTDKTGHALGEGTLYVDPFGDSNATRSIDTVTEFDCEAVEKANTITILKATEQQGNNPPVELPITTFDPQYYQPLKITIGH